jgi:predicted dehydrogenase
VSIYVPRMSTPLTKCVQVALIGCGTVSQLYYTPALQELERQRMLEVRQLFDPDPRNLATVCRAFPNATSIANLADVNTHLAIVASPPRFHAEQSVQLLQAGINVLCEKPIATSTDEAEAMIAAADSSNQRLAVGLFRRFLPATQMIRALLQTQTLGEVQSFSIYEGGVFSWPVQSAAFFKKQVAGGGVLLDIGVHALDLLLWWWGEPVALEYEDDAMGGVEANCHLKLSFAQGFTGDVRLSRDGLRSTRYHIHGKRGWLNWSTDEVENLEIGLTTGKVLKGLLHEASLQKDLPVAGRPAFNFQQSFVSQLCNVVATINGNDSLTVPGTEGLRSLRVIEQCYGQRRLMAMPWLSEVEQQRANALGDHR